MDEIKNQNYKMNELIKDNKDKDDKINNLEYKYNEIIDKINKLDKLGKLDKFNNKEENEIKLIYRAQKEGNYKLFGNNFLKNNKYNIEVKVNECKFDLKDAYKLDQGDNIVIMNIINPINDFSYMFNECSLLTDISSLEKLNVSNCKNFSYMFYGCRFRKMECI